MDVIQSEGQIIKKALYIAIGIKEVIGMLIEEN
ncbi:MAG: hypothetical protein ACRC6K_07880 [Fusobacteriaceae bacterium]